MVLVLLEANANRNLRLDGAGNRDRTGDIQLGKVGIGTGDL